jgi:hypothetical protein
MSGSISIDCGRDVSASDRVSAGGGRVRVVQTARVGRRPASAVARDLPAPSAEDEAETAASKQHGSEALLSSGPPQEPARRRSHVFGFVAFPRTVWSLKCGVPKTPRHRTQARASNRPRIRVGSLPRSGCGQPPRVCRPGFRFGHSSPCHLCRRPFASPWPVAPFPADRCQQSP